MAEFRKRAVDGMIDLEHLSLDEDAPSYDPDARGHYRLEIRKDARNRPELWMIVSWAPDGEQRIREKRQRYVSPAFYTDGETKRVVSIHNVALCANPATHGAQPLIAASSRGRVVRLGDVITFAGQTRLRAAMQEWKMAEAKLTAENLPAVLAAFDLPPDTSIPDVIALFRGIAMAEAGEPQPTEETPPEGEALADEPAPEEEEFDENGNPKKPKPEDEKPAAFKAFGERAKRWSGKGTLSEASDEIETWRQSHLDLEAGRAKLKAEQAKLEASERRKLAVELVAFKGELPAVVWADPTQPADKLKLSRRILDEPIGELRARHAAWKAAAGGKTPRPPTSGGGDGAIEPPDLTPAELHRAKAQGIDPKFLAASKAKHAARKAG